MGGPHSGLNGGGLLSADFDGDDVLTGLAFALSREMPDGSILSFWTRLDGQVGYGLRVRRRLVEAAVDPRGQVHQNQRTMTMGEIRATVTLENRDDRGAVHLGLRVEADVRRATVEGIVDTGAVNLVIPEEIATELGLRDFGTRTVIYADERREERPVTDVTIEVGDLATRVETIVGPAGSQVLIGQVVLEQLDLIADCKNRTLTPRHPEGPVLALR